MALRQLASRAGVLTGLAAGGAGVAYCAKEIDDKYFDPEALERGAKALREIQSSPFAKKVGMGPKLFYGERRWRPGRWLCG